MVAHTVIGDQLLVDMLSSECGKMRRNESPRKEVNVEELKRPRKQDSLGRVLLWTFLGIPFPGLNFIGAGMVKTGVTLLILYVGMLGSLIYYLNLHGTQEVVLQLASDPQIINILFYTVPVIGVLWSLQLFLGFIASRRHHMPSWKKATAWTTLIVLIASILTPTGIGTYYLYETSSTMNSVFKQNQETNIRPSAVHQDPWTGVSRVNVLALGSDAGEGRIGTRPDVIMVLSINPQSGRTDMFNIPRNLRHTPFPEGTPGNESFPQGFTYEEGLINSVWMWGDNHADLFPDDPSPGLTATEHAVEGALGLEIDYSLSLNMKGFEDMVDALGGVTVDVPRDLPKAKEGVVPTDWVVAGEDRKLNGDDALWYVRSRAGSSDYDRMERTRCMVKALTSSVSPQTLATQYPKFLSILKENFVTDIPQADIPAWAELFSRIQQGGIEGVAFTDEVITPFNPDYAGIHAIVDEYISESEQTAPLPTTQSSGVPYVVPDYGNKETEEATDEATEESADLPEESADLPTDIPDMDEDSEDEYC